MAEQFHEGQEAEVQTWKDQTANGAILEWHKAKIVKLLRIAFESRDGPVPASYLIEFADRARAVVDAEHIRTAETDLTDVMSFLKACGAHPYN